MSQQATEIVDIDMRGLAPDDIERLRTHPAAPAIPARLDRVEMHLVVDAQFIQWLLSPARDNKTVSADPHRHWPGLANVPEDWAFGTWLIENMFSSTGEAHARLRSLVGRAFSARRIEELAPYVADINRRHLTSLAERAAAAPTEPVDVRAHYTARFPLDVIAHMFGIPEGARDQFHQAAEDLFSYGAKAKEGAKRLYELLDNLVQGKRERIAAGHPDDDLTTALIEACDRDQKLTNKELLDTLLMFLGAGWETVTACLNHGIANLLSHPDQLAALRTGDATWKAALDEILRHDAPFPLRMFRFAAEDLTYEDEHGVHHYPAGTAFALCYAGAGRDPAIHGPDAAEFNIRRTTASEHLTFGHGPHICIGAQLARQEALTALPAFLAAFPEAQLAAAPADLPGSGVVTRNDYARLPVVLGQPASSDQ